MTDQTAETPALVTALREPRAYPLRPERVELLQTHISWIFFAGERVYKVKKPVDLGFLDFTTLAARKFFCEEEVRLNRRLAQRVYLGVVPIRRSRDGELHLRDEGEIVDYAVEMVRLPEHRMLHRLLDAGEIDNEQMNAIASLLLRFHEQASTGAGVDEYGTPEAVAQLVTENFEETRAFVGTTDAEAPSGLRTLSPALHAFLEQRGDLYPKTHHGLLARRVHDRRIRDGHGDLHAGNLCLTDEGPVAYDCIEFSPRFRAADVASDLAFLAMDLDYRGYAGFSGYLVRRYSESALDTDLRRLVPFYKGYRAFVRGKVASLTALDPGLEPEVREEKRREAMRYFHLAASYELRPALILLCGLPACGKSWLAERIARSFHAKLLSSDVRRKILAGVPRRRRGASAWGDDLYSPEMKARTYRSLLEHAVEALEARRTVVVDATFSERSIRRSFVDAAVRLGHSFYVVHVQATEEVTRERLAQRDRDPRSMSDAGLDVYLAAKKSFEPPSETPRGHLLEVWSGTDTPEDACAGLLDHRVSLEAPGPR